jgi:hypothetical protein
MTKDERAARYEYAWRQEHRPLRRFKRRTSRRYWSPDPERRSASQRWVKQLEKRRKLLHAR